jgi:uncharacterized protein with HEPN domain
MRESAQLVLRYAAGVTFESFENNIEKGVSVIRRIQLVGEAASQVSEETRAEMPNIEWRRIVGMRHLVVHRYWDIDLDIVWGVVNEHLPRLIVNSRGI